MNRVFQSARSLLCALTVGAFAVKAVCAQEPAATTASLQPATNCVSPRSAECPSWPSGYARERSRPLSRAEDVAAPNAAGVEPLRLRGDAAALRLDLHQTTIADVLSALHAAFHINYRASIALDEPVNGTYAGSLERVIARVLNGYDYVIRQDNAKLDVIILGKAGERAVANPGLIPLHQRGAAAYQNTRH